LSPAHYVSPLTFTVYNTAYITLSLFQYTYPYIYVYPVIYDSPSPTAHLIGVEYLISKRLYQTLDSEEQKYWHTHTYEVKSGMLVSPELPVIAEKQVVQQIANMYCKVIHTWQIDNGDLLPIGPPQLMTSITESKYIDPEKMKEKEKQTKNISSEERAKQRQDLVYEDVDSIGECNSWIKGGEAIRFETKIEKKQQ
jgi:hypothetical protein